MPDPYTIRIFVPDGDPDSVRIVGRQLPGPLLDLAAEASDNARFGDTRQVSPRRFQGQKFGIALSYFPDRRWINHFITQIAGHATNTNGP